jgi:DNA-directed RNA polymerase subunit RPC12/RpoP
VNRLVCEDCGTVYYSAAAKTLAEQGATCAKCGGKLVFVGGTRKVPASGPRPVAGNGD